MVEPAFDRKCVGGFNRMRYGIENGERFYASGVLASLNEGERLIGYTKIAQDLTARRLAEAELLNAREELEARVLERTADLAKVNEALRLEVIERG